MIPRPREDQECRWCKGKCKGEFIDNEDGDCGKFIPKRISAEEKFLRRKQATNFADDLAHQIEQ